VQTCALPISAELATSPIGQKYQLRCINVESDQAHFNNLVQNTAALQSVAQNIFGAFGDKIDTILATIGQADAIFFLDPFGIKGIEWRHMQKVLRRNAKTEVLMRINPIDLQRLAGSLDSNEIGAKAKAQLVTDLFGDTDNSNWTAEYRARGAE